MKLSKLLLFICIIPLIIPAIVHGQDSQIYRKGLEFAAEGKFEEAKEEFKKSVSENKSDDTSLGSLNFISEVENNKIEKDYAILIFQGMNFLQKGDTEKALDSLEQAVKINPDYPKAYNLLGIINASSGKNPEAENYFKKALQQKEDYAEACFNLASLYQSQSRTKEAIDYYNKSITLKPDSFESYFNLGLSYASLEDYNKAIDNYKKAIELDSHSPKAYFYLGLAYLMSSDYSRSKEYLQKARKIYADKSDTAGIEAVDSYLNKFSEIETKIRHGK